MTTGVRAVRVDFSGVLFTVEVVVAGIGKENWNAEALEVESMLVEVEILDAFDVEVVEIAEATVLVVVEGVVENAPNENTGLGAVEVAEGATFGLIIGAAVLPN